MTTETKNKLAIGKRNEFAIWGYLLGEQIDVAAAKTECNT